MTAVARVCRYGAWFLLGAAWASENVPLLPAIVAAVGLALVASTARDVERGRGVNDVRVDDDLAVARARAAAMKRLEEMQGAAREW